MNIEMINRPACKAEAWETLQAAQVPAKPFTLLYLLLTTVLGLIAEFATPGSGFGLLSGFAAILANLMTQVLTAGFILYCMAVRRGERAEYLTLFDGFSMAGKIIGLAIVTNIFIVLWSMLFVIPGIIAAYRYHFAMFNLLENPDLGVMEALNMSKQQTMGYKGQLFVLDLSYFGWSLLATAPATIYAVYTTTRAISAALYLPPEDLLGVLATLGGGVIFIAILTGAWAMAVGMFYVPNYYCVQLTYFDIAKRTSGVRPLPEDGGYNGGDYNGGGYNGGGYNGGGYNGGSYNGGSYNGQ